MYVATVPKRGSGSFLSLVVTRHPPALQPEVEAGDEVALPGACGLVLVLRETTPHICWAGGITGDPVTSSRARQSDQLWAAGSGYGYAAWEGVRDGLSIGCARWKAYGSDLWARKCDGPRNLGRSGC